jgi:hypothetical protein
MYETELRLTVAGTFFNKIYKRSKFWLRRVKRINWEEKKVNEFDVHPQYHNLLKVYCKGYLKQIAEDVGEDGVIVVTTKLISARFRQNKDIWKIVLTYGGDYYDKKKR